MIRYIDLTEQIWNEDDEKILEFSWYDTVTGKIIDFNGENVWSSWEDFEYDFNNDHSEYELDRFKKLFPGVVIRHSNKRRF